MPTIPAYQIYAMRYAESQYDLSTFLLTIPPGHETTTRDFFVWLLQGEPEPIVVDTGFTPQIAAVCQRTYHVRLVDQLRTLGGDAKDVKKGTITHLHWDHFGGVATSPTPPSTCKPKSISTGPAR